MGETVSVGVRLSKRVLEYIDKEAEKESVDRSVVIRRLVEKGAQSLRKKKQQRFTWKARFR